MVEVYPNLFIGEENDYESTVKGQTGWLLRFELITLQRALRKSRKNKAFQRNQVSGLLFKAQ